MKKRIAMVMVLVMAFMFVAPAGATNSVRSDAVQAEIIWAAIAFLAEEISADDEVEIGEGIPVYRVGTLALQRAEYDMYPIYMNGALVALADVYYNANGSMQVLCTSDCATELSCLEKEGEVEKIAVIFAAEGVYIYEQNGEITLLKERQNKTAGSITDILRCDNQLETSNLKAKEVVALPTSMNMRAVQYMSLDIARVNNDTTTCCRNGICWAASIAMIANYFKGTEYSALAIHNRFGCLGNSNERPQCYVDALNDLSLYTVNGVVSSTLTYLDMATMIQGNRVPFMRLLNQDEDEPNHVVVGKGYYWSGETGAARGFYLVDPNTGTNYITFPTSGDVCVTLEGVSYTLDYYIPAS